MDNEVKVRNGDTPTKRTTENQIEGGQGVVTDFVFKKKRPKSSSETSEKGKKGPERDVNAFPRTSHDVSLPLIDVEKRE